MILSTQCGPACIYGNYDSNDYINTGFEDKAALEVNHAFDMTYAVKFLGSHTSKVLYIASDLAPVGQYEAAGQSVGWAPAAP